MSSYIFFIIVGFLSGSIMYSYLIPKYICNKDIRIEADDNNPGTVNALKQCGIFIGLICLFLDLGKGFAPIYFAHRQLDTNNILFSLVLLAPVFGHAFSPFLKFKGGKAIATTFGCMLGIIKITPMVLILAVTFIFFSTIIRINPHFIRVILTFFVLVGSTFFIKTTPSCQLGIIGISVLVVYKHLPEFKNIIVEKKSKNLGT